MLTQHAHTAAANRDIVLGGHKGLYIVDLKNPYETPRFVPHTSTCVSDLQCNPWTSRSNWVASTSNQKALIFNLDFLSASPVERVLHAHTRAITDINWASSSPELLATCGLDGRVWTWDLRVASRPVWGVFQSSGATQVKWNRMDPHVLASSHDSRVLIWDDRVSPAGLSGQIAGMLMLKDNRWALSLLPLSKRTRPRFMESTGLAE